LKLFIFRIRIALNNFKPHRSRKIDGDSDFPLFKLTFNFVVKNVRQGDEIREKVEGAGYECSSIRYDKPVYSFDLVETLDARKLMQENVLKKTSGILTRREPGAMSVFTDTMKTLL